MFPIAVGDTISDGVPSAGAGNIDTPDAVDDYVFNGTAGQMVRLNDLGPACCTLWWQIYAPDGTTVWAKGFYGQRTQQGDGPLLRNVTRFYGGGIGVDRLLQPDLRLGGSARDR